MDYTDVDRRPGRRSRGSTADLASDAARTGGRPCRAAPPPACRAAHLAPAAGSRRLGLISPPVAAFLLVYVAALAALLSRGSGRPTRSRGKLIHSWNLDNFRAIIARRAVPTIVRAHDRMAAAVTVTDMLLAFPFAYFLGSRRGGRGCALILLVATCCRCGQLPRPHLLVAADPQPGRRAQLGAERRRPARPEHRLHELGDVVVFTYIWLPFMVLPVYAALERVPQSYLEASRDLGAHGLDDVPQSDPAARAARPRRRLDLHVLADARRLHHAVARRRAGSTFIGNVVYRERLGLAEQRCRSPPRSRRCRSSIMADLPRHREAARAHSRRSDGDPRDAHRGLGVGRCSSSRSSGSRSGSWRSTRSTPRTSRAGRSPASRRSGSTQAWNDEEVRDARSGCRSAPALLATAVALVLGSLAAFGLARFAVLRAGRRSRSCSSCRSRCRGSSPASR